jgi:uroporphyrinogen-III synthase
VIAARGLPEGTAVLYPAAEIRADPLEDRLVAAGLVPRLAVVYRTVAVPAWPDSIVSAVASGRIDVVQVMSRRSGEVLSGLMRRHGLHAAARRINVHALAQEAVATDLASDFRSVTIAPVPTLAALIGLLCGLPPAGASNKH